MPSSDYISAGTPSSGSVVRTRHDTQIIEYTVGIVSAYLSNNQIAATEIPELITTVYNSLAR